MKSLLNFFFLLVLFSSGQILRAQSLAEDIKKICAEVGEVPADKLTYGQAFTADPSKPYLVNLLVRTTDAKGKQSTEELEFNLGDIDKNTVRWKEGKVLTITMSAAKGQKFIRATKDGTFDAYVKEVTIYARNIDNARNIEAALKSAIPVARNLSDADLNIKGKSLSELLDILFKTNLEVSTGDGKYIQKFEAAGTYSDRIRQTIESYSSKGISKTEVFEFSIGDLNEISLNLEISSKFVTIECGGKRNLRWISVLKEGKATGFEKEIKIFAADPEQGKYMLKVLQLMIPLGETEIKKRLPKEKGVEALKLFCALPSRIGTEKGEMEQQLQAACFTTLSLKKNNELMEYSFNFGDLNEKALSLDIGGKGITLKAKVISSEEWIQEKKDGVILGYDDDLSFALPDVESARYYEALLSEVIAHCRQPVQAMDFGWLQKNFTIDDSGENFLKQKLEFQSSGEACKWKFSRVSISGKTSVEEIYEFGLSDIDSKAVKLKVSGKKVYVVLQTKLKQKIISYYKDGKPGYQSDINFEFPDVEAAKIAKETVAQLIENCLRN